MAGTRQKARTMHVLGGASLLLCVLSTGTSSAQSWIQQSPTGSPPTPRYTAGNAYDAAHDRLILFSGEDDLSGPIPPRKNSDVWVLQNATGPTARRAGSCCCRYPSANYPALGLERTPRTVRRLGHVRPNRQSDHLHGGCWWNCSPALADTWFSTTRTAGGTPVAPPCPMRPSAGPATRPCTILAAAA
jgi:hypothetical protein